MTAKGGDSENVQTHPTFSTQTCADFGRNPKPTVTLPEDTAEKGVPPEKKENAGTSSNIALNIAE